jgi:hypothetical protein
MAPRLISMALLWLPLGLALLVGAAHPFLGALLLSLGCLLALWKGEG